MFIIGCLYSFFLLVFGDEITLVDWRQISEEVSPVLAGCRGVEEMLCQTQPHARQDRLCNCQETCEEYGDCCLDYEQADHRNTNMESKWMCVGTRIGGPSMGLQHYYMVGRCPHGYEDQITAAKCMKQAIPADYTYNLDIPVSSIGTGKVYVNIFCAICNNDGDSLHQQEVSIHCDNQDLQTQCGLDTLTYLIRNGTYVKNELRWDTTLTPGVAPNNCTSQLYVIKCHLWLAKSLPHAAPCAAHLTRECSQDHLPDSLTCQLYKLPVQAADGRTYHNPHCAACNGQDINTTTCYSLPKYFRPIITIFLPALSVLLDWSGPGGVGQMCGTGQFYDSLFMRCYSISCGFLYENIAGRCEKRNISKSELSLSISYSLEDCFMVPLNAWEVDDEFKNGSIIHKQTKKFYDVGEYEIYHVEGKDI